MQGFNAICLLDPWHLIAKLLSEVVSLPDGSYRSRRIHEYDGSS